MTTCAPATANEKSTSWLTVNLLDTAGLPAAPNNVTYRIDDEESGASVVPDTLLVAPGSSFQIKITPAQNAMLDPAKPMELRRVTVIADYGVDDQMTAQFDYFLVNLRFVS